MTDKKTIGSFIKSKRIEKHYSQKDLAEILFVTESAVSKWERGVSYPDITLVSDICRVLEISEHEFLTASTDTDARKIKQEARKFRVIRGVWFWVPTISYIVAFLICLICNLAVNRKLSWSLIVFAALICTYAFIPTFSSFFQSKKLLVFTTTSLSSICLLLLTCAVYTKTLFWVPTACIGVLIGYILLFPPMLLSKTKIKPFRFLVSFALSFLFSILLLLSIHAWHTFPLGPAIKVTCYGFLPVFFCGVVCVFHFDAFIKTGVCILFSSVTYYFSAGIVNRLFDLKEHYYEIDFHDWEQCANANIYLILLLSLLFLGVIFTVTGAFRILKKGKE